jgi:5-(aminomethyl)-3-furanmethanol phosphate kinase
MNSIVVKVGGSLALHPFELRALCNELAASSKNHKLLVVPGGGEFADVVRLLDQRFSLSAVASDKMAILGMDQYGVLLADLIPNGVTITELSQTEAVWNSGKLPVLLPSSLMLQDNSLEHSWEVTSDSIAMYIATKEKASKLVLVTDVDGVYNEDPKTHVSARFLPHITSGELSAMDNRTCIDKVFPTLLSGSAVACFVVNGLFAERVHAVFEGKLTVCTKLLR